MGGLCYRVILGEVRRTRCTAHDYKNYGHREQDVFRCCIHDAGTVRRMESSQLVVAQNRNYLKEPTLR